MNIYRQDGSFNVDNVRVSKILGSGLHASDVVRGMVFQREAEGDIRKVENAKIAAFSCPLDSATTETKVFDILPSHLFCIYMLQLVEETFSSAHICFGEAFCCSY